MNGLSKIVLTCALGFSLATSTLAQYRSCYVRKVNVMTDDVLIKVPSSRKTGLECIVNPISFTGLNDDQTNMFDKHTNDFYTFFATGESTLSKNDSIDILNHVEQLKPLIEQKKVSHLVFEGRADPRGEGNGVLSKKRAYAVANLYKEHLPIPLYVFYFAASNPIGCDAKKNDYSFQRQVKISINDLLVHKGLDMLLPVDNMLIDASGSMRNGDSSGIRKWDQVNAYIFPHDTEISVFTSCDRLGAKDTLNVGLPLSEYYPTNSTPLYVGLLYKVSTLPEHSSIALVTDGFDTTSPKKAFDMVYDLAIQKNISISCVFLSDEKNAFYMRQLHGLVHDSKGQLITFDGLNVSKRR